MDSDRYGIRDLDDPAQNWLLTLPQHAPSVGIAYDPWIRSGRPGMLSGRLCVHLPFAKGAFAPRVGVGQDEAAQRLCLLRRE